MVTACGRSGERRRMKGDRGEGGREMGFGVFCFFFFKLREFVNPLVVIEGM